jgi:hypothetical protein
MTSEQRVIKTKVGLLELAKQLDRLHVRTSSETPNWSARRIGMICESVVGRGRVEDSTGDALSDM